jgi:hypothetical protein
MGDGTKANPFTREDVLKLIEENGGTARGLDLSRKEFEEGINLSNENLSGVILRGARFPARRDGKGTIGANFTGTDLRDADLRNVHLEHAEFYQAELSGTKLEGAYIYGAHITEFRDPHLGDADWGEHKIIGEEIEADKLKGEDRKKAFIIAEHRYRQLKMWYTNSGYYNVAGEFFYREMETKRKRLIGLTRFWYEVYRFLCGYGERPLWVIGWAASVILGLALIYFAAGSVWEWGAFWSSLYFSVVSFAALGYGSWLWTTNDWIKGIGAFESFIGVFTMALFLVTFVRKMTR